MPKQYPNRLKTKHLAYSIAIILVMAISLGMRVYHLDADPPTNIGQYSQDLTTDPHHLTSFAANYARTGESEPFPFAKWQVFKVSIVSWFGYGLFQVGNPSRILANLAGVIPSFIGLSLLVWGICIGSRDRRSGGDNDYIPALIAAIFLGFNFILVTYNRAPFMESGLIFYFGLIFFLFQKYQLSKTNIIILSVLVSLSFLTGKAFGISIGLALFLTILTSGKEHRGKLIWFVGGGLISGIILILILYGDRAGVYYSYLTEHSLTAHGASYLLDGPKRIISRFLIYGTLTGLFTESPFLTLAFYISLVLIILSHTKDHTNRSDMMTRFSIFWLVSLAVLLIPANYRPLRYSLLIYLPMLLIIISGYRQSRKAIINRNQKSLLILSPILFLINWFVINHIVVDYFYLAEFREVGWTIIVRTFLPAVILTAVMVYSQTGKYLVRGFRFLPQAIIGLAVLSILIQLPTYRSWASEPQYSIRDASADLAEIIGPDAVITGPYGPTLTIDNGINHFIYGFGLQKPEFDIFEKFPITHLAVDHGNRQAALGDYPIVEKSISVTDYFLRNRGMLILRISESSPNLMARNYQPTNYEKAMTHFIMSRPDSAYFYSDLFSNRYPDNRSGLMLKAVIMKQRGTIDQLRPFLENIKSRFPADSSVQFFCREQLKGIR